METIYNWLLENTGNEGNYYTILTTRKGNESESPGHLEVRARRSEDFTVVNLLIASGQTDSVPDQGQQPLESFRVGTEQQVIDYLSTGAKPAESEPGETAGIQIVVGQPTGDAGTVTFPI